MERLRENGTKIMAVIGSVKHALQVAASGIDVVVAQGHDGGGHNSPIGTMALIPQVVDAMAGRIPVLGAGGITDGRGVAAAMMLGAEGAWVGTAFLATEEAGIQQFQKEVLVEYGDGDTVVSKSVTGKPARIIRNKWAQAWVDAEKSPLPMPFQSIIAGPVLAAATLDQRKDIAVIAFDTVKEELLLVKEGLVQALIGQRPYEMGYRCVEMLHDIVQNRKMPSATTLATGVDVITAANVDSFLVKPD